MPAPTYCPAPPPGLGPPLRRALWRVILGARGRYRLKRLAAGLFALLAALLLHRPAFAGGGDSGSFQTDVPIELPPYHGLEPDLRLVYSSNTGNGWLGVGWQLGGLSAIERKPQGGGLTTFQADDRFYLDGRELVPCGASQSPACQSAPAGHSAYFTRIESFERITRQADRWFIWNTSGVKYTYEPHLTAAAGPLSWHLERVEDTLGNVVSFGYWADGSDMLYLDTISYNGTVVNFHLEPRHDSILAATGTSFSTMRYRLRSIDVRVGGELARAYALRYTARPSSSDRSLLAEVQQYGRDAVIDAAGAITGGSSLPAQTFAPLAGGSLGQWEPKANAPIAWGPSWPNSGVSGFSTPFESAITVSAARNSFEQTASGDFDADGRSDWLRLAYDPGTRMVRFSSALAEPNGTYRTATHESALASPPAYQRMQSWPADLNGDARTDLLLGFFERRDDPADPTAAYYYLRLYPAISRGDGSFALRPSAINTEWAEWQRPGQQLPLHCAPAAVNGDGHTALVCSLLRGDRHLLGTFYLSLDGQYQMAEHATGAQGRVGPYRPLPGDFDGDGLTDIAIPLSTSGATGLGVLISQGNGQYAADPARRYTGWWTDADTHVVELNGDGRADLLRMRLSDDFYPRYVAIETGLNEPDGAAATISRPLPTPLDPGEFQALFGDTNNDGRTDMVVAHRFQGASPCGTGLSYNRPFVTRSLSRGDGTLAMPASWTSCEAGRDIALRWEYPVEDEWGSTVKRWEPDFAIDDLDGDGSGDFRGVYRRTLTNTAGPANIVALLSPRSGASMARWTPADLDGDGRQDLVHVYALYRGLRVTALLRQPDGQLVQHAHDVFPELPHPVTRGWKVADANGDGKADLIAVGHSAAAGGGLRVYSLLSLGNGAWSEQQHEAWPGYPHRDTLSWIALDLNRDGKTDLARVSVSPQDSRLTIDSMLANGDGTYSTRAQQQSVPGWTLEALASTSLWRGLDVDGDGRQDLVNIAQRNADIVAHTVRALADGSFAQLNSTSWVPTRFLGATNWQAGDINADGAVDLVQPFYRAGQGLRVVTMLGQGDGAWRGAELLIRADAPGWMSATRDWRMLDANSDGRSDLIQIARQRLAGPDTLTILASRGDGSWASGAAWSGPAPAGPGDWKPADVDGDGQIDLLRADQQPDGLVFSALIPQAARDLLASVGNGSGALTTVAYRPSSAWQAQNPSAECALPLGKLLTAVASVTTSDGRGASSSVQYAYDCPRWSTGERRLLTWREVTATNPAVANRPSSVLATRYDARPEGFAQLAETVLRDPEGRIYERTVQQYAEPGAAPPYRSLVTLRREERCNLGAACVVQETSYAYDSFGNLTRSTEYLGPQSAGVGRETTRVYRPALGPYIVDRLAEATVFERDAGGGLTQRQQTRYCYDGDTSPTCGAAPVRGLLTATRAWNDQDGSYLAASYAYDQWGNQTSVKDANGAVTTTVYDPVYHLYPEVSTNALGHVARQVWDYILGVPLRATDANGASTVHRYDPLGRLTQTTDPNGGVLERRYLDLGDPSKQRVREWFNDGSADGLWSEQYLDGLGRTWRAAAEGAGAGERFVQETEYADASSRPFRQSHWFRAGETPVDETFAYDGAGRLIKQYHADRERKSWEYGNDDSLSWTTALDEDGRGRTEFRDAFGRVVRVREPGDGAGADTTYIYDILSRPLSVTDSAGNTIETFWDSLGRKLRQDDPDMGSWSYTYDAVGNVLTETDARGVQTSFSYDPLNRLVSRTNETRVDWRYDEPGHGASKGRLTSVLDPSAAGCPGGIGASLSYNGIGLITQQSLCVAGQAYQLGFGYDALGRQTSLTYPDGELVSYQYDSAGRLARLPGYVEALEYEPDGQLTRAAYANGTETSMAYTPLRNWLSTMTVTHGGDRLYDVQYSQYLPNGLIASMASSTDELNLNFSYDQLNRLTSVSGDQSQSFRYDALGNMTYNSAVGEYRYGAATDGCTVVTPGDDGPTLPGGCPSAGPHAASQAGDRSYRYDANGNMTGVFITLKGDEAELQRLVWDADNRLAEVWQGGTRALRAVYNAGGERVLKEEAGETTRYFGGLLEHSSATGLTKYYYAGPLLVAQRSAAGAAWYHQDHQGSTRLMTDEAGAVIKRYQYAPFGQVLETVGSHDNDIEYTGHRSDASTGLIYMRARYYNPALARFVSADTIVPEAYNPQSFNRYSYVFNNPVSYVDPSGHEPMRSEFIASITVSYQWAVETGNLPTSGYVGNIVVGEGRSFTTYIMKTRQGEILMPPDPTGAIEQELVVEAQVVPAYWDEMGEYVEVWHKEGAFDVIPPLGDFGRTYAVEHWWIETPTYGFGVGFLGGAYGTEMPADGLTLDTAITNQENMGRMPAAPGQDPKSAGPRPGFYATRVYGPPGFTARVEQQAVFGKQLGTYGVNGTCQTFVAGVLANAGAYAPPRTFGERVADAYFASLSRAAAFRLPIGP